MAAIYGRTPEQAAHAGLHAGVLGLCVEVPLVVTSANVVIIAVADAKIAQAALEWSARGVLAAHQVVLHTSGCWAAREVFGAVADRVAAFGTLHPLASLAAHTRAYERLEQAAFAIEGEPQAVAMAQRLVAMMNGRALGDVATVQRHLNALQSAVPDIADIYRKLGAEVLAVAAQRSPMLNDHTIEKLRSLLASDTAAA